MTGDGSHTVTVVQINPDDKRLSIQWTAKPDGKDYPISGHPIGDAVSVREIEAYTSETAVKSGGVVVQTIRFEVAQDGKTMNAIITGATSFSSHNQNRNIHVLEKQ